MFKRQWECPNGHTIRPKDPGYRWHKCPACAAIGEKSYNWKLIMWEILGIVVVIVTIVVYVIASVISQSKEKVLIAQIKERCVDGQIPADDWEQIKQYAQRYGIAEAELKAWRTTYCGGGDPETIIVNLIQVRCVDGQIPEDDWKQIEQEAQQYGVTEADLEAWRKIHCKKPVLSEVEIERQKLSLMQIPANEYKISEYLKRYVHYISKDSIVIEKPFSIQAHEVTVGEFRRYVESLDGAARAEIGTRWEKSQDDNPYPDDRPVENVSWKEAEAYAEWLSQKTEWDLRLPTLNQWVAACAQYSESDPILRTSDDQPTVKLRGRVDHLLGNLREWSADQCEGGKYRLLGENYMTDADPESIGIGHCAPNEKWTGVGFRLVRIEK